MLKGFVIGVNDVPPVPPNPLSDVHHTIPTRPNRHSFGAAKFDANDSNQRRNR